ncbi:MAG: NAD(+) synthase [Candidatus Hodarchaeales archaeon]
MANLDLSIDPRAAKEKIISVIKQTLQEREGSGLLVIFSGQNDSYTAVKLAIEAIGLDSVKIIILSDVPKSRREEISSEAIKILGISSDNIISADIKKISKQFDTVEGLIPELVGSIPLSRQHNISNLLLQTNIVKKIMTKKTYAHLGESRSDQERFFQQVIAQSKVRKRLKTLLAYLIAERENLLLISKTNKTEWLTGLFTPFGYGHAADIMPLGDLYRTQVLQLAEYLEVPKEIRDKAYTDIIPGVKNKYQYFFELESNNVDKILIRLNLEWQPTKISGDFGIDLEKIERVNHFFRVSKLQQKVPIIPKLN